MSNAQQAAREQVLSQFRADEEALLSDLQSFDGVLLGQGFIVTTGVDVPFALKFDISPEGKVSNPKQTIAKFATRFDVSDARRIAASVKNGNGEPGVAMHVTSCIAKQLQNLRKCIADIESL